MYIIFKLPWEVMVIQQLTCIWSTLFARYYVKKLVFDIVHKSFIYKYYINIYISFTEVILFFNA